MKERHSVQVRERNRERERERERRYCGIGEMMCVRKRERDGFIHSSAQVGVCQNVSQPFCNPFIRK